MEEMDNGIEVAETEDREYSNARAGSDDETVEYRGAE